MGTGAVSQWALGQHCGGHQGGRDLPLPEEPWLYRLAGPCRGSVARHRAPAVPRLAAPGTRRCPCVRLCQVPHACLRLVLCAHHTPSTPCPAPRGAHYRGHMWQWGQRAVPCCAVLCCAGRLQESQACAAAGQPEQGGCHGPDIRVAHPVPWEPCMVPPPHTCGVWAVLWHRMAEPGFVSSLWLVAQRSHHLYDGWRLQGW